MEKKIVSALRETDKLRGLSLEELHKITGLCRNTISKHVGILEAKKTVLIDVVGNNKLVCLNKSPVEIRGRGS